MKRAFYTFLTEVKSYSYYERLFIVFVMLCSICITSEHAIVKPASYSLFISHFSASYFPYAWLAMVPLNFLIVSLYNRFLPRLGCFKTLFISVIGVIVLNVLSSFYLNISPKLSFFHFILKDIYVLLMFQQLWSVVHSTIDPKKAKYLYGIIYGVGGLGSVSGSCIPGFLATKMGSERLLIISSFIYFLFILFYKLVLEVRDKMETSSPIQLRSENTHGGFGLIKRSSHLKFILLIVVFMQLAATFIDFQFNTYLEMLLPDKDLRTAYSGKLFGLIHVCNIFLQFFGAFIIIQLLGLKKSHVLIPLLFGFNVLGFIMIPAFSLVTVCFATIKAFDYSIFTIIKEMLYLPLKTEEKFKAKAIIDVFAYRSSKALASFAILVLQFLNITSCISWVLLLTFTLWLLTVLFMFKQQRLLSA